MVAVVKANQAPRGSIAKAIVRIAKVTECGTPANQYPTPISKPSASATTTVPFTTPRTAGGYKQSGNGREWANSVSSGDKPVRVEEKQALLERECKIAR